MRILDTPIRRLAGRTPRELLLIGYGAAATVAAPLLGDDSWNVFAYAGVTILFAARFFAGRVLYLSMCIAAIALQLASWALPAVTLADQAPVFLQIAVCTLLLSGRDLVDRFDDHGRGLGPLRNFWRDLSIAQRRHVAWGIHLVGTTGACLHHMWWNVETIGQPVPAWLYAGVAATTVVGFLYVWGRALAAPAAVAVGGAIAWQLAPHLDAARAIVAGRWPAEAAPVEIAWSAHLALAGFACAVAAAAIAVPWTVRWIRRGVG